MNPSLRPRAAFKFGAIALAAALSLTACGGEAGASGGKSASSTLLIGTTSDVSNFAPMSSVSVTDWWIMNQMYPPLFRAQRDGSLLPIAAKSATVGKDGKTVKVVLNDEFAWSDGTKLTANDLKFTLERFETDKLLQGAVVVKNFASAKVDSPTELTITLESPSYTWVQDLMRAISILPEHVFKDVPNLARHPLDAHPEHWVSGGSYTLAGISKGQRYQFKRNEHYPLAAEGNEKITDIEFRVYQDLNTMQLALQSGDLDVAAQSIPASAVSSLETKPGIKVEEVAESVSLSKLSFNVDSEPLNSQAARQAISGLIDSEEILEKVLQGRGTHEVGPILPLFKDYQLEGISAPKTTPEEAKKVFEKEGLKDSDNDGFYDGVDLKILCDLGNANHAKAAQVIHDDLGKVGLKSTVACSDRATSLTAAKAGKFDLYVHKITQFCGPTTNLVVQFDSSNPTGANYNFGSDSNLDTLLRNATAAIDEASNIETTKIAGKEVHSQALMVPLYVESMNYAWNTKRFDGYIPANVETNGIIDAYSLSQVLPSN